MRCQKIHDLLEILDGSSCADALDGNGAGGIGKTGTFPQTKSFENGRHKSAGKVIPCPRSIDGGYLKWRHME